MSDTGTRIHAVLEAADQAVYLGFRETDELDPDALVNLGHVNALLRASGDLLDLRDEVAVYLEAQGSSPRRWRLHHRGQGSGPVLTDVPARIYRAGDQR